MGSVFAASGLHAAVPAEAKRKTPLQGRFRRSSGQIAPPAPQATESALDGDAMRRLDALAEVSGNIAHDFTSIFGTVLPALQLALHSAEDAGIRDLVDRALKASLTGATFSRRLLSCRRSPQDMVEDHRLADVFAVVEDVIQPNLDPSLQVEFVPPPPAIMLRCDRALLESVMMNLLFNASDAILSGGGTGTIRCIASLAHAPTEGPAMFDIAISDTGPGMTDDVRARAAEPFFTTRNHGSGSGLGLSIAYGFCRQSGGELLIRSAPGMGTTVTLKLPLLVSGHDAADTVARWQQGAGQHVLVTEPESGLRQSLADAFTMLSYNPIIVASGEAALEKLHSGPVDILLADIRMPGGMNGFELAARARRMQGALPILYMSGEAAPRCHRDMTIPAPVLRKPCQIRDLSRALSDALHPAA